MKKDITHDQILNSIDDVLKAVRDFADQTPTKEETPTKDEMDFKFNEVHEKIDSVHYELKQDMESLQLRQNNVAYRFELNDLERRVEKIESKI